MISSTPSHTQGSEARSSQQNLSSAPLASKASRPVAQVATSTPLPETPTLNIPEIQVTRAPGTPANPAKVSKQERFKTSVKSVFHKSEGSLLSHKPNTADTAEQPVKPPTPLEEKPKRSKRERFSQIFTSDTTKAQTVYFEEGHPLLNPPPSTKKTDTEKLSKRQRLSRALKTEKQLANEDYYADEPKKPLSKRSSKRQTDDKKLLPRPLSAILPYPKQAVSFTQEEHSSEPAKPRPIAPSASNKDLLDPNSIYSPSTQRRNSFDSSLPIIQNPVKQVFAESSSGDLQTAPSLQSLTQNQTLEIKNLEEAEDEIPQSTDTPSVPLPSAKNTGSFSDFLGSKTADHTTGYFTFPDSPIDSLLAEARAFKNNTANYRIDPTKPTPPLNSCCKEILSDLNAYIQKRSNYSLPSGLSAAPSLGQNSTFSAPLPLAQGIQEHTAAQPMRDSQLTKTNETVTVDLDHFQHDKRFDLQDLSRFLEEFIKYSGLVGDLVALGKHTWVVTHTYASMSLYSCPKRMGCRPSGILSSIVESNRSNKGVMYKEVNSETLRNARKLSTPYTMAYAESIRKNVHWKSTLAKFIGSCIAVSGIFTILLSNAIDHFNPNIAFGIYGYYLITISIGFFLITQFCKTLQMQCLSLRETKQMNIYRDLLQQNTTTYIYGSIQNSKGEQTTNALQEQTLQLINTNFDFALRHILESLKVEQERPTDLEASLPQILPDPNQYIHNPQGPTYIFLKATLGIKKNTLNLLLKEYKKDELRARRILHELVLDTKMLSS